MLVLSSIQNELAFKSIPNWFSHIELIFQNVCGAGCQKLSVFGLCLFIHKRKEKLNGW
jgi:hypothetical protein